jgi:hypothetical protein
VSLGWDDDENDPALRAGVAAEDPLELELVDPLELLDPVELLDPADDAAGDAAAALEAEEAGAADVGALATTVVVVGPARLAGADGCCICTWCRGRSRTPALLWKCPRASWCESRGSAGARPLATEIGSDDSPIGWCASWLAAHPIAAVAAIPSSAAAPHIRLR